MLLGYRVRDQHGATAVFEEMTSSPACMEASRFCDAFVSLPGHHIVLSYAEQAYTQAELSSNNATCIQVPPMMRTDDLGSNRYLCDASEQSALRAPP